MTENKNMPWHLIRRSPREKISLSLQSMFNSLRLPLASSYVSTATPALAVRSWIRYLHTQKLPQIRQKIVVIAMRNETWFEWAMYACCWLRRLGYGPILVYSTQDYERLYGNSGKAKVRQFLLTRGMWEEFKTLPDIILIAIEQAVPAIEDDLMNSYKSFAEDYAHTVTAYDLHVEEREQVARQREYIDTYDHYYQCLSVMGARFEKLFGHLAKQYGTCRLVGFSGMIDLTCAANEASRRLGWHRFWVETWGIRPGQMIWSEDFPVMCTEYSKWLEAMKFWDDKDEAEIESFLLLQKTGKSTDRNNSEQNTIVYQTASINEPLPDEVQGFITKDSRPIFLMGPNIVGDSATLRRATIFDSQRQWIEEVVSFFRNNSQWRLIVRLHPWERLQNNLPVRIAQVAGKLAADAENILIIPSDMQCSSYSLMPHATVGLNWVSNFGVDCVLHDVPTISAARPCYSGLGITIEPCSKIEYFTTMERLVGEPRRTTERQKLQAKKYLSVLYKHASLEAFGPRFRASDVHLDYPAGSSFEVFYRILAGELPSITWFYRN